MKKHHLKSGRNALALIAGGLLLLIAFQNCSDDFDPSAYMGDSSSQMAAPTISTPQAEVNAKTGDTVMLSFSVKGGNLTYKWYKDDQLLTGPAAIPMYQIGNIQPEHAGTYRLCVENGMGIACATIKVILDSQTPTPTPPNTPTVPPTPTPAYGNHVPFACVDAVGRGNCGSLPYATNNLVSTTCQGPLTYIELILDPTLPPNCTRGTCLAARYSNEPFVPLDQIVDFTVYYVCQ